MIGQICYNGLLLQWSIVGPSGQAEGRSLAIRGILVLTYFKNGFPDSIPPFIFSILSNFLFTFASWHYVSRRFASFLLSNFANTEQDLTFFLSKTADKNLSLGLQPQIPNIKNLLLCNNCSENMPLNSTVEGDVEPNQPSHDIPSEGVTDIDDDVKNTTAEADTTTTAHLHAPQEADGTTSPGDNMDSILENLTEGIRNQEDIQRDITTRANIALVAQEDERDEKRIERATTNRDRLANQKQKQLRRLDLITTTSTQKKAIRDEIADIDEKVAGLNNDIVQSQERIQLRHVEKDDADKNDGEGSTANRRMPNESQRDFLIRTGKITPFSRMETRPTEGPAGELTEILMEAEEAAELPDVTAVQSGEPRSHQYLRKPGFEDISDISSPTDEDAGPSRPRKKRRVGDGSAVTSADASEGDFIPDSAKLRKSPGADSAYTPDITDGDFVVGDEEEEEDDEGIVDIGQAVKKAAKGKAKAKDLIEKVVDDGNEADYQKRLKSWVTKRSRARRMKLGEEADVDDGEAEWFKRSPDAPDHHLPNNLRLPGDIYPALYDYQKTGVQWLGELYASQVGGIVGDEMGLGKTYVYPMAA